MNLNNMKFGYDWVVVGGATEDIFFTVDDYDFFTKTADGIEKKLMAFPYGAKVGVPFVMNGFGGGAHNVAVGLAQLGFRTALLASVGTHSRGQGITAHLQAHGVETRYLQKQTKVLSGVSFILVHQGHDHIIFTHRGANDHLEINRRSQSLLKKAKTTYITSLSGQWKRMLPLIFRNSRRIAWNPGRLQISAGLKYLKPFLKETEVLFCNKAEAAELVASIPHHKSHQLGNLRYVAKTLQSYVKGMVVITNGEKGALAYNGTRYYQQPAKKVKKIIDTTGVGDAFGASFMAGLTLYRGDIQTALQLAAKNSAAVLGKLGAHTHRL